MNADNDIILSTTNLTKVFKTVTAVEDLNLNVRKGDVFGFLGPNGAGKSTAIRMMLGLVKPTRGDVSLLGNSLGSKRQEVLSRVGALVEAPSFYEYLSGRRNLEIFAALANKDLGSRDIDHVLDIVALLDRGDHKVKTYSRGMKQRLGVAQALLGNPELVILDEPTAGMDPKGIKEIRRLILQLAQEGFTIFLSSHILHEIEMMCKNMAIVNKGKLIIQGPVEKLLNSSSEVYSLKVEKPERALRFIHEKEWGKSARIVSGKIVLKIEEKDVPDMNEALVQSGFRIFEIQPRKSLEDYFLSVLGVENV